MKMTKTIVASAFTSVLISNSAIANDTGTVSISGGITEKVCTIPGEQLTREISMTKITPASLNAATEHEAVADKEFSFSMTDCPAGLNSVGIRFEFTPDSTNPQYMTNSGTATGVAFGISDMNNTLKNTTEVIDSDDYDATAGTATVKAKLRAYRVGSSPATSGDIESSATVTLVTN